jgi:hypothetical protein
MSFAAELELARAAQRFRMDPEWCVLRAVADAYGIDTDPMDEVGYKGPWHAASVNAYGANCVAGRLLYFALGYTQREVIARMGCHAAGQTRPDVPFGSYAPNELELLDAAEALYGGPLS